MLLPVFFVFQDRKRKPIYIANIDEIISGPYYFILDKFIFHMADGCHCHFMKLQ